MTADEKELHARVCVLEDKVDRHDRRLDDHDGQFDELQAKVSSHDACVMAISEIKDSIKEINKDLRTLSKEVSESKTRNEATKMVYLTIREWIIVAIALATLYLSNFR